MTLESDYGPWHRFFARPMAEKWGGLLQRLDLGVANVVYHGAVADGSTDDSAAFAAADAAGPVLVPEGNYNVKDVTFTHPPVFLGEVVFTVSDAAATFGVRFDGSMREEPAVLGGFYVDITTATSGIIGVVVRGINWIIPKIQVRGTAWGDGQIGLKFVSNHAGGLPCSHNQIGYYRSSRVDTAILLEPESGALGYCSNNLVSHAYLQGGHSGGDTTYGIKYVYPAGGSGGKFIHNAFYQCYTENQTRAVFFDGSSIASNIMGVNGDLFQGTFDTNATDLYSDYLQPNYTVIDSGWYTISTGTANSADFDDLRMLAMHCFFPAKRSFVATYKNHPSTSFTDGDTTPDVTDGNLFTTANTGATTITDFDSGFSLAGKEIIIIAGDGNTTITDGANIVLNGSANWTMGTTDTLTLVSSGGVWYETARSNN